MGECQLQLLRDALELRGANPGKRSDSLYHLAISLISRFWQSGKREDLDEAIELFPESLNSLTDGHPSVCTVLSRFGCALMQAYSHIHDAKYIEKAMAAYPVAVTCQSATLSGRFTAARAWARHADNCSHELAMDAYQAAIELLPGLVTSENASSSIVSL